MNSQAVHVALKEDNSNETLVDLLELLGHWEMTGYGLKKK